MSSIRQVEAPEDERLTLACLVHHLLVELAHAAAAVDEVDAEEAGRDRARVGDRQPPGAGAAADDPCRAVPDDPRAKLGELVRQVAPGSMSRTFSSWARERSENGTRGGRARGAPRPRPPRRRRRRRPAARARRAGCAGCRSPRSPLPHRPRDDRGLEQVGPELREDPPLRDRVQLVPRAPDALQPARHRLRALHLDDEVDRAHVDPELERGRDEAGDAPAFRSSSTCTRCSRASEPWCARAGSSRRARSGRRASRSASRRLLTNTIVERCSGRARGSPGRSKARSSGSTASTPGPISTPSASGGTDRCAVEPSSRMSSSGTTTSRSSSLRIRRRRARSPAPSRRRSARSPRAGAGSRRARSAGTALDDTLEALQREREVGAALRPRDRVHLVEDHGLDPAQGLARLRGEEEEERLGRGDEDVGRRAQHAPALLEAACRPFAPRRRAPSAGPRAGCRFRSMS